MSVFLNYTLHLSYQTLDIFSFYEIISYDKSNIVSYLFEQTLDTNTRL